MEKYKELFLPPNLLCWARLLAGIFLPFLLFSEKQTVYFAFSILFFLAAITDFFDGWLARKLDMVSDFGKWLDPFVDKILVFGCLLGFSLGGLYSIWWIIAMLIREVIVTFCRTGWLFEGKSVGAEKSGKIKFCLQVVLIALSYLYWGFLKYNFFSSMSGLLEKSVDIFLYLSVLLTLASGVSFLFNQKVLFKSPYFSRYTLALGVGFSSFAPGTMGSLLALLFILLTKWSLPFYILTGFFFWLLPWFFYKNIEKEHKDPGFFILDEVVGMYITFAFFVPTEWWHYILGFLLFRLFDIWKPFPARQAEKLPGVLGVMIDDVFAGVYAGVLMVLLLGFIGS